MPPDPLSADYWNERYLHQDTGWDMKQVSPPLRAYFEQLTRKDLSILIPGCGNAYEAAWLLEKGFTDLTLTDFAPEPVARLREQFAQVKSPPLTLLCADFFSLEGQYDLIIEQTFFCALDPSLRERYVTNMYSLLKPGGRLAGLLFDRTFEGGPPFGGNKEEYAGLLEKNLMIRTLAPCYNSIRPRAGTELFFIAERPA